MSINKFNVDVDVIRLYNASIQIDPRSGLESQIDEMINLAAATVAAEAQAVGVDASTTDTDSPTYHVLRGMVIFLTLDHLSIARNHGADNDLTYRKRYEDYRATLRANPSKVTAGGDGKPDNPASKIVTPETSTTEGAASLINSLRPSRNGTGYYW